MKFDFILSYFLFVFCRISNFLTGCIDVSPSGGDAHFLVIEDIIGGGKTHGGNAVGVGDGNGQLDQGDVIGDGLGVVLGIFEDLRKVMLELTFWKRSGIQQGDSMKSSCEEHSLLFIHFFNTIHNSG